MSRLAAQDPIPGLVAPDGEVQARIVSTDAELSQIAPQWRQMAEDCANPFLTPEWFAAACRHYPDNGRPAVVVAHRGKALIGLLPLVEAKGRLRFAGANLGDWFRPLAVAGEELAVVRAAAVALAGERPRALVLDNVLIDSDWWAPLRAAFPGRTAAIAFREDVLPRVELGGLDWDDFLATRSSKMRAELRRRTRKLARERDSAFRLADEASLAEDIETFFRLHEARWRERGGSSALTESARAFHRDFARSALARGWLRLRFLELGGEPVAVRLGWRLGASYCCYQAGFLPDYARMGVGQVLVGNTIASAIEEGVATYDFLLGDEPYKAQFATRRDEVHMVVLTSALSLERARVAIEAALWRAGRRVPDKWRPAARSVYRAVSHLLPAARRR